MELQDVNKFNHLANAKVCAVDGHYYVIGGMNRENISKRVYEFRLINKQIEWRQIPFKLNLLGSRHSFAACAGPHSIFVWGGLLFKQNTHECLSDLIEINPDKRTMTEIALKTPYKIHSSCLFYDEEEKQLIGYGGTAEGHTTELSLYYLNAGVRERVEVGQHEGCIWQHSGHFTKESLFSGAKGKFLTIIGGTKEARSPYSSIVEIDILAKKQTYHVELPCGLVSHDSILYDHRIFIFGGSTGSDFNQDMFIVSKGVVQKKKGHKAVGCCCCLIQNTILVYGGVRESELFNGAILYKEM